MNLTFIGGGNMATALLGGLIGRGHAPAALTVIEPDPERRNALVHRFGVQVQAETDSISACDILLLAVKPQILRTVLRALPPLPAHACVLSVAAGVRAGDIQRWLGGHAAIVRAMPNTPALIGAGISGAYALEAVSAAQRAAVTQVLEAVGEVVWVDDETAIDAVTAVSGSGPAYVFYFIEALEAAARELGLSADTARRLSLATVEGAAALARHEAVEPAELCARVTSKGGTTERGIAALDAHGFQTAVLAAARAAAARAAELGDALGAEP